MCLKKYADLEKRNKQTRTFLTTSYRIASRSYNMFIRATIIPNGLNWWFCIVSKMSNQTYVHVCSVYKKYKKPKVNLCLMEIKRNFKCFIPIKGVIVFIRIRFYLPANACIIIIVKITLHFKVVQSMKKTWVIRII